MLSIDIENLAGCRIDIDFHVAAESVAALDLPFVAGKLGMGYGDKTDIGRDTQASCIEMTSFVS